MSAVYVTRASLHKHFSWDWYDCNGITYFKHMLMQCVHMYISRLLVTGV